MIGTSAPPSIPSVAQSRSGQVRRNNEIDPTQLYVDAYDGLAYRELGLSDSALAAFARAKPLANGQPLAGLALLYARLGRKREAVGVARELEAWYRSHYYAPEYIAVTWANIGDMDRAFMWLEKVLEVRSSLWLDFGAGAAQEVPEVGGTRAARAGAVARRVNRVPGEQVVQWA